MSEKGYMLTYTDPKSPVAEAYRILRRNIQFSSVDKSIKVIVITSAGPGEGKTSTTMNLGIAFAQSGSRVLVIDTDLRKPMIHKSLDLPNTCGMSKILAEHENYTYRVTTPIIENFNILTSGPTVQNPSEYFTSNAMKNLIEGAKQDFDIILIDAPPIGIVTDVAILSTIADGTILVTASGQVKIGEAQRAKELLVRVNANILGVVLNKISSEGKGNYYNYNNHYNYDEGQNNKKSKRKFFNR
jgi:capsular exopolysaccharide synthesis family protein